MNQSKKSLSSVLGLALEGSRLEGTLLKKSGGGYEVLKSFSVTLGLNPLTAEPELLGREIRNHLDNAGIREKRCVLGIPASWALTAQSNIPDLPEEDLQSFLDLEAERNFSAGADTLIISNSFSELADGKTYVTMAGVPRNQLLQIERALRLAKLNPLSFTFAISALQKPDDRPDTATTALLIGAESIDLQITHGNGVAALRSLEGAEETESARKQLDPEVIAREVRITIGNLPPEFRGLPRRAKIFEAAELPINISNDIRLGLERMGMKVQVIKNFGQDEGVKHGFAPGTKISPASSLAAAYLSGATSRFQFLPPRVSSWQQLTSRVSSKKLTYGIAAAAAIILLVGGVFGVQQWQLSKLRNEWAGMAAKVEQLKETQRQIKQYRPWFDNSFRTLSILRLLTEAFPEDGVVSAKTLAINDTGAVVCSGVAQNNQAFLKVIDNLRATRQIENLKIDSLRGKSPLQFNFTFQWATQQNER